MNDAEGRSWADPSQLASRGADGAILEAKTGCSGEGLQAGDGAQGAHGRTSKALAHKYKDAKGVVPGVAICTVPRAHSSLG